MRDTHYFRLGLFTCFTLALLTALLLSLGMLDYFRPKARLVTLVSESVQGLTPGSAVKYRGVPIGTVSDITINIGPGRKTEKAGREATRLIRIDMTIDLTKFKTEGPGGPAPRTIDYPHFEKIIRGDIRKGLCCNISPDGITGMKYIDLDFSANPPPQSTMPAEENPEGPLFVPSVPSVLKDLRTSVFTLLDNLNSVDYAGISKQAKETFASVQKLAEDPKIPALIQRLELAASGFEETSTTLRKSFSEEQVGLLIKNFDSTLSAVRDLADYTKHQISNAEISKTSDELQRLLSTLNELGVSISHTLTGVNEAFDSATELIQYLDVDPASLIRGKGKPSDNRRE